MLLPVRVSRAWLVALLADDLHPVSGIHDRLVLLVPAHPVVLMAGLAQDLEDFTPSTGLAVDSLASSTSPVCAAYGVFSLMVRLKPHAGPGASAGCRTARAAIY